MIEIIHYALSTSYASSEFLDRRPIIISLRCPIRERYSFRYGHCCASCGGSTRVVLSAYSKLQCAITTCEAVRNYKIIGVPAAVYHEAHDIRPHPTGSQSVWIHQSHRRVPDIRIAIQGLGVAKCNRGQPGWIGVQPASLHGSVFPVGEVVQVGIQVLGMAGKVGNRGPGIQVHLAKGGEEPVKRLSLRGIGTEDTIAHQIVVLIDHRTSVINDLLTLPKPQLRPGVGL